MPKFEVTIGRDATQYFGAKLEGANIEEIKSRLHSTGIECPENTVWKETNVESFDNVEVCYITDTDGTQWMWDTSTNEWVIL